MKSETIIPDEKHYEEVKQRIKKAGLEHLHIISDFDKTITKVYVDGRTIPSIISLLRDNDYISEEYSLKAKELFKKYNPIEIDPSIPHEQKKKAMESWWNEHFDLLIKSKLNKNHLERAVKSKKIPFREGFLDFLDLLKKDNIPFVIFSSSGIGDAIPMMLEEEKRMYSNVFVLSNFYNWDNEGNATSVQQPIIHCMNKGEIALLKTPFYEKVRDRKNVILIGDTLDDLGMIEGFNYTNLLKVGFLNQNVEENLSLYKQRYDVVITNDEDFSFVNDLIEGLK